MAFGFPANHVQEFRFAGPDDWRLAWLSHTVAVLRWNLRSEMPRGLVATTSVNFFTWGERIEVLLADSERIVVASRCRLVTQCIDYGVNQGNVMRFARTLRAAIEAAGAAQSAPPPGA